MIHSAARRVTHLDQIGFRVHPAATSAARERRGSCQRRWWRGQIAHRCARLLVLHLTVMAHALFNRGKRSIRPLGLKKKKSWAGKGLVPDAVAVGADDVRRGRRVPC